MKKVLKVILGIPLFPLFLVIGVFVGLFEVYAMYDEIYDGEDYE